MGSKERRERQKAEVRQKIIDAALDLLISHRFLQFSMRRLAERVEYSPAAIYLHFESKEHLAGELRRYGWQLLSQQMVHRVGDRIGQAGLQLAGKAYLDFAMANPALYRLMFMSELSLMQAAYADVGADAGPDAAFELILRILGGLKGFASRFTDPTESADIVWSSLHGLVSLYLTLPGLQSTPPHRQCELVLMVLADGLEADSRPLSPVRKIGGRTEDSSPGRSGKSPR